MALTGHKVKYIVLTANTLVGGQHCDKAIPLEVIEADAKNLTGNGRVYLLSDGKPAVFDTKPEADALIAKLGWKPEEYEADRIAAEKAAAKAKR